MAFCPFLWIGCDGLGRVGPFHAATVTKVHGMRRFKSRIAEYCERIMNFEPQLCYRIANSTCLPAFVEVHSVIESTLIDGVFRCLRRL